MSELEAAYLGALAAVRDFYRLRPAASSAWASALLPAERLAAACEHDEAPFAACRSTPARIGFGHAVNVAILSARVATRLDWKPERRARLALFALVHDVARAEADESPMLEELRLHPVSPERLFEHAAALEALLGSEPGAAEVFDSHERTVDERRRDNPSMAALLLALCDLYETLAHPRSWRTAVSPHETVLALAKLLRRSDDQGLVGAFIEAVGLYPAGSLVRLSTNEIAIVLGSGSGSPTLPRVELLTAEPGRRLDLKKYGLSHVDAPVLPGEPMYLDKLAAARLAAMRWRLLGP